MAKANCTICGKPTLVDEDEPCASNGIRHIVCHELFMRRPRKPLSEKLKARIEELWGKE